VNLELEPRGVSTALECPDLVPLTGLDSGGSRWPLEVLVNLELEPRGVSTALECPTLVHCLEMRAFSLLLLLLLLPQKKQNACCLPSLRVLTLLRTLSNSRQANRALLHFYFQSFLRGAKCRLRQHPPPPPAKCSNTFRSLPLDEFQKCAQGATGYFPPMFSTILGRAGWGGCLNRKRVDEEYFGTNCLFDPGLSSPLHQPWTAPVVDV